MAPFDNPPSSTLTSKISPLIDGQLPDFIRDDHPLFSKFLQYYYEYLEAAELTVTVELDNILQETVTDSYILDEEGRQIVYEDSVGKFSDGETITGGTSGATATILVDDLANGRMFITSQQQFINGETITGGTSTAEGTVKKYRANPVQNIQQLLEYADTDGTIHDFLDQLSVSFMNAIPKKLATGINKRNLIKNIRELYRTKGTSESFKLFIRILLNLDADIVYPEKFMMRASDSNYSETEIIRTAAINDANGSELLSQKITGQTSGATAVVASSSDIAQGGVSITEFSISQRLGTFSAGEVIRGTSSTRDVVQEFTIYEIISGANITNDGILNSVGDEVIIDTTFGTGLATAEIEEIKKGGISGIVVDSGGTGYQVGDPLVFTTTEENVDDASGFVSVVDGALLIDGTDTDSTNAGDYLVYESATKDHIEYLDIQLEEFGNNIAKAVVNGSTSDSTTIVLDGNSGTIEVGMILTGPIYDDPTEANIFSEVTVTTVTSQNNITVDKRLTLKDDTKLTFTEKRGILRLETGTTTATDLGHKIKTDTFEIIPDTYETSADQMALEEGTVDTGEITRVFIDDSGGGYSFLPTITLNPTRGTKVLKTDGTYLTPSTAKLIATTTDIGAASKIKIIDTGANYSSSNIPPTTFRANFVLKDVSGTFAVGESLTSHVGVVKSYNTDTQVLQTTLEDVVRTKLETTDALPIGLEDGSAETTGPVKVSYDNTISVFDLDLVDEDDSSFRLNSTGLDGDGFVELEDDTGSNLLAESLVIDDPLTIELEDGSGKVVAGDPFTKKIIREIPKGIRPNRRGIFGGAKLRGSEPGRQLTDPDSGEILFGEGTQEPDELGTFGTFVQALTHKETATAVVNNTTTTSKLLQLDGNVGTIVVGMTISDTGVTAVVNGATALSDIVGLDGNSGIISVGMTVTGTNVGVGVTVTKVSSQTDITLSKKLTLADDTILTFKIPSGVKVATIISQTNIILDTEISLTDNTELSFVISEANGPFVNGEEITGATSGATALILNTDRSVDGSNIDSFVAYIPSNSINFIDGEVITGEAKIDSNDVTVYATATITSLDSVFIPSPNSVYIDYVIETITDHNGFLLESGNTATYDSAGINYENQLTSTNSIKVASDFSDIISLESSGPLKSIITITDKLLLDGTDTTVNTFGRTNAGGFIVQEVGGDIIILETDGESFIESFEVERSTFDELSDQNLGIILDGDLEDVGNVVLEDGDILLDESSSILPQGVIILDGTDTNGTDAGYILLGEIEAESGSIAADGYDDDQFGAGTNVIQETGIDFSAGTTTITASGGFTGTIVNADISKASTTVGGTSTILQSFGGSIKGLLGEDLNRLQDSYFYQQFSYEVQTGAGTSDYMNEMNKAVHPAGFLAFGKVSIKEEISVTIDKSQLVTISTFIGDGITTRRLGRALAAFEMESGSLHDVIVQEDSLSTGISEFLSLDGTDGSSTNAGDNILQESATAGTTTNNLILDATDFNESDVRGDILLDGTDTDGTDAGGSFELEDELHTPKNKIVFERIDNPIGINHNAIINEDGGFMVPESSPLVGSGPLRLGETTDVSVIKTTTLKLAQKPFGTTAAATGLVGFATPFGGADTIETELGTIKSKNPQEAHHKRNIGIIPTFHPLDVRQEGSLLSEDQGTGPTVADLSAVPLSDFIRPAIMDIGDDPYNTTESSETVGIQLENTVETPDHIILNGTDSSFSDAGSFLLDETTPNNLKLLYESVESGTQEAGAFKQEDESTVATTHGDDILLENATGYNLKEKLLLESSVIELEENTVKNGVIPHQNYLANSFDNIVISSDIESEEGLGIALEDNSGPDHILLNGTNDNTENAGFFLVDESDSANKILFESVETGHSGNTGVIVFDGTDSDSSNAGDKAIFENATRSDILNNSSYTVPGVPNFTSTGITMDSSLDMSVV